MSRELNPLEPGVVTVGAIHGGFKHNVIPDRVELQLTVRANSEETREHLLSAIERIAEGVGRAAGLPSSLQPNVVRTEGIDAGDGEQLGTGGQGARRDRARHGR